MSECENCGDIISDDHPLPITLCKQCNDEKAMAALSSVDPPEDGWPRGSDMDRL